MALLAHKARNPRVRASGPRRGLRGRIALGAVLLGTTFVAAARGAESPTMTEYELKAAFLYNFARFVEWPPEAFKNSEAPIVIGVLGADPFGPVLDHTVAGQTIHDRPLVVRRAKEVSALQDCHILFISASEKRRLAEVLERIPKSGILTVADTERFAEMGGMINLFMEAKRVKFEINVDAATRAGLKINAQLLRLARIVGGKQD